MKTDRIPDIYLERYLLGELPEKMRCEIELLLSKDNDLAQRLERMKESDREVLAAYPAELMAGRIIERKNAAESLSAAGSRQSSGSGARKNRKAKYITAPVAGLRRLVEYLNPAVSTRLALSAASAVFAVIAAILLMPWITGTQQMKQTLTDDVRIKGAGPKLVLYRIRGKQAEEMQDMSTAHKGDIIQAGYIATGEYRYGVIISIDGRGTVTTHFPESGSNRSELVLNKKTLLNRSYELDDSPRFERFIMVLSPAPIDTSEVIKKAKKLAISGNGGETGSLKSADNIIERSVTIRKAAPRR